MQKNRLYTLIYGDLISSRKIDKMATESSHFSEILTGVNDRFDKEFLAPLKRMRGTDEIAAVIKKLPCSFEICRVINEELFPLKIRFVITQGSIDSGLDTRDTTQMDGQVFHQVVGLMKQLKVQKKYYHFDLNSVHESINQCLSAFAHFVCDWHYSRTENQNEILRLFRRHKRQRDVAQILDISQQAVSDSLIASNADDIYSAEKAIIALLEFCDSH